jgi:hypothetical protein
MRFHLGTPGGGYSDGTDEQEDPKEAARNGEQKQEQGDGLHHHQIDQNEGGGFHSVHTHPDGHEDHADHTDYEEAKVKMDSDFGEGGEDSDGDGGEMNVGEEDEGGGIAEAYGRRC